MGNCFGNIEYRRICCYYDYGYRRCHPSCYGNSLFGKWIYRNCNFRCFSNLFCHCNSYCIW